VGRAAGAVAKRAFLGHLYRNCTQLRPFQRLLRLLRHAKSITCVDAIWPRGSNPTLSAASVKVIDFPSLEFMVSVLVAAVRGYERKGGTHSHANLSQKSLFTRFLE